MTTKSDRIGRAALWLSVASVALILLTVGALAMPAARARLGLAPARTAAYAVGGRIDVPPSVYTATPYTVILFARSTCAFCERAKPLFAQLATALADDPAVRMVMVSAASGGAGDRDYARAIGLDEGRLVVVDPGSLKLKTVPTIVLVDREGRVQFSHEGVPSPADLEELRHASAVSTQKR